MKLVSHLQSAGPTLYVTPLLNTVLLLVVFFFVGRSVLVQSGVGVALPESASRIAGFEQAHVISVPAGPDATFYYDGRLVTLKELQQTLERVAVGGKRVIIHGDQAAPYGRVMEINALALSLGFEVAHATTPKEEP